MDKMLRESVMSLEDSQTIELVESVRIRALSINSKMQRLHNPEKGSAEEMVLRKQIWSVNQRLFLIERELIGLHD